MSSNNWQLILSVLESQRAGNPTILANSYSIFSHKRVHGFFRTDISKKHTSQYNCTLIDTLQELPFWKTGFIKSSLYSVKVSFKKKHFGLPKLTGQESLFISIFLFKATLTELALARILEEKACRPCTSISSFDRRESGRRNIENGNTRFWWWFS